MFQLAKPLFLICETPLHAGAGGGVGTELPIQREGHTRFPKIEASSLKGALREAFEGKKSKTDPELIAAFGHPDENAGALGLTDARILLFPVKSLRGVFAWTTCPRVLTRLVADLNICINAMPADSSDAKELAGFSAQLTAAAKSENTVASTELLAMNGKVFLDEFLLAVDATNPAKKVAEFLDTLLGLDDLQRRFIIVSNETFDDFVTRCTEVHTRIKIDDDGIVADGQLFTEEHLPAESVLYSLLLASPEFSDSANRRTAGQILGFFKNTLPRIVQIGGNATLGKGIVRAVKTFI